MGLTAAQPSQPWVPFGLTGFHVAGTSGTVIDVLVIPGVVALVSSASQQSLAGILLRAQGPIDYAPASCDREATSRTSLVCPALPRA